MSEAFEPLFVPITLSIDVDQRLAHLDIPGVLQASGEPIRSPIDGSLIESACPCPTASSSSRPKWPAVATRRILP